MMGIALIAFIAYLLMGAALSSLNNVMVYDYRGIPDSSDFYTLSNEDIGFIANLVDATNNVHSFHLPLPSHIDLLTETTIVDAIEFIYIGQEHDIEAVHQALDAFIGYPDRDWTDTFNALADADDEAWKSKLAGPIRFGINTTILDAAVPATTDNVAFNINHDRITNAIYFPPVGLDQLIPIQIDFVNRSELFTMTTMASAGANFTGYETTTVRVWYRIRNLTRDERMIRSIAMRFLRIES